MTRALLDPAPAMDPVLSELFAPRRSASSAGSVRTRTAAAPTVPERRRTLGSRTRPADRRAHVATRSATVCDGMAGSDALRTRAESSLRPGTRWGSRSWWAGIGAGVLLAVLVAVFAVVGSALEQSHEPPAQVGTAVVSVAAGESLHDLAARTAPAERVSDSVAVIRRLNHLDGVQVAPASEALLVPVYHG